MPSEAPEKVVDPRIRRTRLMLRHALEELMQEKEFERISVQDIAEAATVNRVTFYDHYPDKFALLECLVRGRFNELLAKRGVEFDGTCSSALTGIVLAVCDYLASVPGLSSERTHMEPHLEAAVIAVMRAKILGGLREHPIDRALPVEIIATTLSWAIYGAAQEWARTPDRPASEGMVGPLVTLVSPIAGY